MTADDTAAVFSNLLADPGQMAFWMILTVILGFFVCSRGLAERTGKISKIMMSALLILIVVLAVHSITLQGAAEGVKFYLVPNLDTVAETGLKKCDNGSHESGIFHTESWRCRNGDLRKLYGQRSLACR